MKVVLIYQFYQSAKSPGHSLSYSWTQYLASKGHDVTVISGSSGYMKEKSVKQKWYKMFLYKEELGSVTVYRTYAYSAHHKNYLSRLIGFLSFSISSAVTLLFMKKPDIIIGSTPPIFPAYSSAIVSWIRRVPYISEVRDLWPDSAVEMGVLKNRYLISIMRHMEKFLYNRSKRIICLTQGITNSIVGRGWDKNKVDLITYGVDLDNIYPDKDDGKIIREKYHIQDKKVILYFGALGEANNMDVILRAAEIIRKNTEIVFMLVGDGMQRSRIKSYIDENNLSNILLLDPVGKDQARKYINAADICIVTLLDIPLFKGALPSKLFDYIACGKPVLCGVGGEAKSIIEKTLASHTFSPNDENDLIQKMENILSDYDSYKEKASADVKFIQENYSLDLMLEKIENCITKS